MYLRGPNERGEGPLPPAAGYYPPFENLGTFTVDVYAEDLADFAGFQIEFDLPSGCYVAYDFGPSFGGRMVTWNDVFLPDIGQVYRDQTVGLTSNEREWDPDPPPLGTWGEYVDKTIPAEEDDEAVNPEEMVWEGREGLTWLMSITYWYDASIEGGTYTLDEFADNTAFANRDAVDIPYTIVTGSVDIMSGEGAQGGGGAGGEALVLEPFGGTPLGGEGGAGQCEPTGPIDTKFIKYDGRGAF